MSTGDEKDKAPSWKDKPPVVSNAVNDKFLAEREAKKNKTASQSKENSERIPFFGLSLSNSQLSLVVFLLFLVSCYGVIKSDHTNNQASEARQSPKAVSSELTHIPSPSPYVPPAPPAPPAPTAAQIWKAAGTETCWGKVKSAWGFESPKPTVVGTYAGMGYTRDKLDYMYTLTQVAANRLLENGRDTDEAERHMSSDWLDDNETAARFVVLTADQVYLPAHLKIAAEKCVN